MPNDAVEPGARKWRSAVSYTLPMHRGGMPRRTSIFPLQGGSEGC